MGISECCNIAVSNKDGLEGIEVCHFEVHMSEKNGQFFSGSLESPNEEFLLNGEKTHMGEQ